MNPASKVDEATRAGVSSKASGRGQGAHELMFKVSGRSRSFESRLSISTSGLMAVSALVSGVLLSVAVLVVASTRKLADDIRPRDL